MAKKEYIEREALRRGMTFGKEDIIFLDGKTFVCFDNVKDAVLNAPAADVVEVRHGYWKDNRNGTFICSVCGGQSSKMDYCGRCGAKMDGKGEGNV